MKKILIILLALLIAMFFIACPTTPTDSGDGGDGGDGGSTGYPDTLPEDFESYDASTFDGTTGAAITLVAPGGEWGTGVSSTDTNAFGPLVFLDGDLSTNVLLFAERSFADQSGGIDYGAAEEGHVWAQLPFTAPAAGTISFDYLFFGWSGGAAPSTGSVEFWLDYAEGADGIETETSGWDAQLPEGTNTQFTLATETIDVTEAGTYWLTWRYVKDWTGTEEDTVRIDNIVFTEATSE